MQSKNSATVWEGTVRVPSRGGRSALEVVHLFRKSAKQASTNIWRPFSSRARTCQTWMCVWRCGKVNFNDPAWRSGCAGRVSLLPLNPHASFRVRMGSMVGKRFNPIVLIWNLHFQFTVPPILDQFFPSFANGLVGLLWMNASLWSVGMKLNRRR